MKVLVLNPPFLPRFSRSQRSPAVTKSGTLYYPFWLAYTTGVLEEAGFETLLVDAPADGLDKRDVLKLAKDFNPRLIVLDTSTPSIYNDVEIAASLKNELPDSFVTLVGTHVSALPEETLNLNKKIDALARGEYDYTIRDLAYCLKAKDDIRKVEGISFRQNNTIIHNPDRPKITNLDELPFVSKVYKRYLNIKNYFFAASDYPEVQIFTGRGCPFRCFFCVYPQTFHGRNYRARSPANVVEEFKFISNELPQVKEIIIEDDTFTINSKRVVEICDLLISEGIKTKWNANVRLDLELETMKKMKKAGCHLLIIGFESADQTILDNIHKGYRAEKIREFVKNAKTAGLLMHAAFMAGNPGETKETLAKNIKLAKELLPDTVQFFPLMVYPGTEAYQWAQENGYLMANKFSDWLTKEGLHNCVIGLPNLSAKNIVRWCDVARKEYYLNPRYLLYKLKQIAFHPEEIKRTIKATMGFRKYLLKGSFSKKRDLKC